MTRSHAGWRIMVLAATGALLLAACGSGGSSSADGPRPTLNVGLVWSLSGEFAPYGQPAVDGANLAVSEINRSGGVKVGGKTYTLSLTVQDDRSDPQTAVAAATQLIRDDKVAALLGPIGPLAPSVAKLAAAAGTLQISPSGTASELGGTSAYPYLFASLPANQVRGTTAAEAIKSFLPYVKSIAIMGPTSATQQVTGPPTVAALQAAGFTVRQYNYPTTTTDLRSVLTQVAASKPDLIFMGWTEADWQLAASALSSSGLPSGTPILAYAGAAANASLFPGHPYIADPQAEADISVAHPTPAAAAFEQSLKKFLGKRTLSPDESAAEYFYESVLLLAKAMEAAGTTTDTSKIADALNKVEVTGIYGKVGFRRNQIDNGFDYTFIDAGTSTTKHFS